VHAVLDIKDYLIFGIRVRPHPWNTRFHLTQSFYDKHCGAYNTYIKCGWRAGVSVRNMVIFSVWRLAVLKHEQCRRFNITSCKHLLVFTISLWYQGKNGRYISVVSRRQCYASSCLVGWHWTWHESRVTILELLFWKGLKT